MSGTAKLQLLLRVGGVVLCREMPKVKGCRLGRRTPAHPLLTLDYSRARASQQLG